MNSDQVKAILQKRIDKDGLRETARQLEISAPYLSNIMQVSRPPSETIAAKLGLRRIIKRTVEFVRA